MPMALGINVKPRMRAGGQWCSAECTQKTAVMLSKAILSQAAVAALVEGGPVDRVLKAGERNLEDVAVSPRLLESMRIKLIDSMEWSHHAYDGLKEMIMHKKNETLPLANQTPRPCAQTERGEGEQIQQSFIEFLLSDEGQRINRDRHNNTEIASLGFAPELSNILSPEGQLAHDLPGPPNELPTETAPAAMSIEMAHYRSSSWPDAATHYYVQ